MKLQEGGVFSFGNYFDSKIKVSVFLLMFLMLASGVLAMDDPIKVKAHPGDEVKVYIWPAEYGPLLNMKSGIADENGSFETTFFSLNVPSYKIYIIIIDSTGTKIRNDKFYEMNTLEPITIDCIPENCTIFVGEVVEDVVENETVVIPENVSIEEVVENETVVNVDDSNVARKIKRIFLTGKAIFTNDNGSVNWGYSIGGFSFLLFLIIFIFSVSRRGKVVNADVLDEDEKELECMEKKVRETADKIKSVKEKRGRREKIESAKKKLAEEEAELKKLEEGGNDDKIEKQEDVVEKAVDNIEKVKDD